MEKIRPLQESDLPQIKKLMLSIPNYWHDRWDDTTLKRAFSASAGTSYVYESNHEILGCVFGYDLGFRGYISALAVHLKHQKKGIGSQLLQQAEKTLKQKGCKLVIADVLPSAKQFYEKAGWEKPFSKLMKKEL